MSATRYIILLLLLVGRLHLNAQGLNIGTPDKLESSSTVCADNAGNMYIAGNQNEFPFITKMTDQGVIIWNKHYELHILPGDKYQVTALHIIADTLYGCGVRKNSAGQDKGFFYFKGNANTGALYWHRNSGVDKNYLLDIRYHNNKFLLIGGSHAGSKYCGRVIAVSSQNAQQIWRTPEINLTFPERNNFKTTFRGATDFVNGIMYVTGATEGSGGGNSNIVRPIIVGVTENGTVTIQKYLETESTAFAFQSVQGMAIAYDGTDSLVIVGSNHTNSSASSNTMIFKTDLQANIGFCKGYNFDNGGSESILQSFNITPTGYVLFGGLYTATHNGLFLLKTDKAGVMQEAKNMFTNGIGYFVPYFNETSGGNGDYKNGKHYFIAPEDYGFNTYLPDVHPYIVDENLQSPVGCDNSVPIMVTTTNLQCNSLDCGFVNYTQTEPGTDVYVPTNLLFPDVCAAKTAWFSENVTCSGTIITVEHGGFINPVYSWSDGSTGPSVTVDNTTPLTVTISDINCCYVTITMTPVISQEQISVSLPNDTVICMGINAIMYTIVPDVQANPSNVTYNWSTGSTNSQIAVNVSGTYWVDVSNSCGTVRDSMNVVFTRLPMIYGDPSIDACSIDFPFQYSPDSVVNSNTMSWENGVTTLQRSVNTPGNYTLTATNACGQASFVVTVSEKPLPQIHWISLVDTCLNAGSGLPLTPVFTDYDQILWSTGETEDTIFVEQPGIYTVTASNECGSVNASAQITVNYLPELNLPFSLDTCFEIGEGFYYTAEGTPGNYAWSSGSQTATELITDIGVYDVTLSNVCGSVTKSMIVNRAANLSLSVAVDSVLSCQGNFPVSQLKIETNYDYEILNEDLQPQSDNIIKTGWYYIHAFNKCGEIFDSVFINLQENQYFYLPNAFTPNQDACNEYYSWKGENIVIREFRIFNRWGEEVFDGSDPLGWDGTFDGQRSPDGIYSIRVVIENCQGIGEELTGFVTLLR